MYTSADLNLKQNPARWFQHACTIRAKMYDIVNITVRKIQWLSQSSSYVKIITGDCLHSSKHGKESQQTGKTDRQGCMSVHDGCVFN